MGLTRSYKTTVFTFIFEIGDHNFKSVLSINSWVFHHRAITRLHLNKERFYNNKGMRFNGAVGASDVCLTSQQPVVNKSYLDCS